jgi:hypothetical protein
MQKKKGIKLPAVNYRYINPVLYKKKSLTLKIESNIKHLDEYTMPTDH